MKGMSIVVMSSLCMLPLCSCDSRQSSNDSSKAAKKLTLNLGKGVTIKLALIPAGKFMMGTPAGEKDRRNDEGPQREVTISKPFYMGIYEVTQEQYEQVMGTNPSKYKGKQNPVLDVSWSDALEFCRKLSQNTGKTVRLPTEAEWEHACRAGTKTRFSFGDDAVDLHNYGNYCDKSNTAHCAWQDKAHNDGHDKEAPVGSFKPNAFGLYDMHGNAWEWCADWYDGKYYANANNRDPAGPDSGTQRVLRGGGCNDDPRNCRSACRGRYFPDFRGLFQGFRVVVVPGVD